MTRGRKIDPGDALELVLNVAVLGSIAFAVLWFIWEGLRLFVF